jgi:diadenosine tetraphosphatase ApaH/serine/threonine PP2A family protein phosphatase
MLVRGTEFAYNFRTVEDRRLWLYNGGHETIASYGDKVGISPEEDPWAVVNSPLFQEHRTWMAQLPFYLEYPDLVTPEGRTVFASHACPSGNLEQDLQSLDILWNRNAPSPKTLPGKFSIYGHTVKREPILTDWHANLDTGATFQGFGKLTCLIVPDMKIIQVDAFPEEQFGFKTPTVPKTKEADPEAFEV